MKVSLLLVLAAWTLGCGNPASPTLCVGGSGADIASLMACSSTTSSFTVRSGEPIYVVHKLPNGIDPGGETVFIELSTACGTISQSVPYSSGVAFAIFEALPGAQCSASVTATIENSTLRVVSTVDPSACADAPACPADAGAPTPTDASVEAEAADASSE